jgi:hypothetical protein
MNVGEFARHWPYCYHVTFYMNLGLIQASGYLYSAETLLSFAGEAKSHRRRMTEKLIRVEGRTVILRNQRALDPRALDLPRNCSLSDYLAFLNERTYFWPGTSVGPVADGIRMLEAGGSSVPAAVIRVESESLMEANKHAAILVATCNTGAAWRGEDVKCRRALDLVRPLPDYPGDPGDIIEVSFVNAARLPRCSEYYTQTAEALGLLSLTKAHWLRL